MVEATLSYLARMSERPEYWLVEPPAGTRWRNTKGDRRAVDVHDARQLDPPPTLDREGFDLVHLETRAGNLYDPDEVREIYYAEVEDLVKRATGASRVLVFDHNVRNADKNAAGEDGAQSPVKFVHCDYTVKSGPQRVRDLLPDEAESLIANRFAVVNVWKPISGSVQESPLAFQDARTVADGDVLATDLRYHERTGEIYSYTYNPGHRWYYYPQMQADEVLLLKCYDSDPARARFPAHTAIEDPTSPADAPARESIEVRTLVFFPADASV
jgi:hypothetical protein